MHLLCDYLTLFDTIMTYLIVSSGLSEAEEYVEFDALETSLSSSNTLKFIRCYTVQLYIVLYCIVV